MPEVLDRQALWDACYEVARRTMWERRPVDAASITALAGEFARIGQEHEEFIVAHNRDPNLIVRAIEYLAGSHAIPPMRDDTRWFSDMLAALVELACPNAILSREQDQFLRDIEHGIATSRSRYADIVDDT